MDAAIQLSYYRANVWLPGAQSPVPIISVVCNSCTGLCSSSTQRHIQPRIRCKSCDRSFSSNGPRIWNTVHPYLHDITDTAKCKRFLNQNICNLAFLTNKTILIRCWTFYFVINVQLSILCRPLCMHWSFSSAILHIICNNLSFLPLLPFCRSSGLECFPFHHLFIPNHGLILKAAKPVPPIYSFIFKQLLRFMTSTY